MKITMKTMSGSTYTAQPTGEVYDGLLEYLVECTAGRYDGLHLIAYGNIAVVEGTPFRAYDEGCRPLLVTTPVVSFRVEEDAPVPVGDNVILGEN